MKRLTILAALLVAMTLAVPAMAQTPQTVKIMPDKTGSPAKFGFNNMAKWDAARGHGGSVIL